MRQIKLFLTALIITGCLPASAANTLPAFSVISSGKLPETVNVNYSAGSNQGCMHPSPHSLSAQFILQRHSQDGTYKVQGQMQEKRQTTPWKRQFTLQQKDVERLLSDVEKTTWQASRSLVGDDGGCNHEKIHLTFSSSSGQVLELLSDSGNPLERPWNMSYKGEIYISKNQHLAAAFKLFLQRLYTT